MMQILCSVMYLCKCHSLCSYWYFWKLKLWEKAALLFVHCTCKVEHFLNSVATTTEILLIAFSWIWNSKFHCCREIILKCWCLSKVYGCWKNSNIVLLLLRNCCKLLLKLLLNFESHWRYCCRYHEVSSIQPSPAQCEEWTHSLATADSWCAGTRLNALLLCLIALKATLWLRCLFVLLWYLTMGIHFNGNFRWHDKCLIADDWWRHLASNFC